MKRKWNWPIWVGFVVALGGLFSYEFFVRFPITRDFPWANLLLFGIGTVLLLSGLFRAFGRPQLYRGKIFGSIFTAIALFLFAFFSYEIFLRPPPGSALISGAARWRKGAGIHVGRSKWKAGRSRGFAFRLKSCRADFLSRLLVTALQLRVAEFSATTFGFRCARDPHSRHQR